mmetsp:Transcript_2231/g.3822  ORF Transcript_2231/g.3822 Transcript_2231/m.3822 type:complete len:139 (-) Transcript_2231:228-644(-)
MGARHSGPAELDPEASRFLWSAAKQCKAQDVRGALSARGDPNVISEIGKKSALTMAVFCDNMEVMEVLLAARADVHSADRNGRTALHEAIAWEKTPSASLLCKHGASADVADSHGLTPRILAGRRSSTIGGLLPPPPR